MTTRSRLLLFLKGLAMGAADVVPGVSGGTIAFISGIYEELIDSIGALGPSALRELFTKGPKQFWQTVNGNFLLTLGSGIVFSIVTLARVVTYGLAHHSVLVWAFFFGLIIASVIYIGRQLGGFSRSTAVPLIMGALIALTINFIPRGHIEATPLVVFGAGMIAICAMILPGVSGSFILLLMGLYAQIIAAISQFDLPLLIAFGAGCLCGLLMFSRLLSWFLHHHRQKVLALLTGFLAGSLAVVWPWKRTLSDGDMRAFNDLLWPWHYYADSAFIVPMMGAVAMMILGFVLVLTLESLTSNSEASSPDDHSL